MRNFPGSNFDLSGLDASPFEIGAVLDAVSEAEAEAEAGGGYDADDLGAAEWAASLTDAEFGDLMAEYEADQALAHLPGGPELAGADAGNATFDLANDGAQLDMMLSQLTNREATRQQQDADEMARRGGPHHRRPSAEIKLATAMRRVGDQTYTYGQADLAADPDIDGLFAAGPSLNAAEVAQRMAYELKGGAKPQGRGEFLPPVADLATRIGLR